MEHTSIPAPDILSMNENELAAFITGLGEKPFRSKQLFRWMHQKLETNYDDMTDLPAQLREKLKEAAPIKAVEIERKFISDTDGTIKYLFSLGGSSIIESVFMQHRHGTSVCVSTQAGCRMGCSFCASTIDSLDRNLTPGEMASQVYAIQKDRSKRVDGVVLMGSGEPLDNYDNVIKLIRLLNSKNGLDLGQRHITLSTCGLVPEISRLAEEDLQITLAISLHAPTDELRSRLMPINKRYPVDQVIKAGKDYSDKTKRRLTIEYAMLDQTNDSPEMARILGKKLKGGLVHVNLIPFNPVKELNYQRSKQDAITLFADILRSYGVETTLRRELGGDIDGACGQLRRGYTHRRNPAKGMKKDEFESNRENQYRQNTSE